MAIATTAETSNFIVDQDEVMRLASQDKVVRKLEKILRDIQRLEGQQRLDRLQLAKVAKKPDVVLQLDSARGLAASRARDDLRKAETRKQEWERMRQETLQMAHDEKASSEHSDDSSSTRAESSSFTVDEDEVMRLAFQDEVVRKLQQVLRDIQRIEARARLDKKMRLVGTANNLKADVFVQLDSACDVAASRARDDLQKAHAASL
eukprot:TRINITY_DN4310_c0_g2_i1.p1 TRINITY_DN4310_c0_g2~~TRINITY_DN4310_c0_g2_i1.p1  ORF type:complete len:206 (-),score=43.60 TRINITY_DN4310_c0_g2_i1:343-960(-)